MHGTVRTVIAVQSQMEQIVLAKPRAQQLMHPCKTKERPMLGSIRCCAHGIDVGINCCCMLICMFMLLLFLCQQISRCREDLVAMCRSHGLKPEAQMSLVITAYLCRITLPQLPTVHSGSCTEQRGHYMYSDTHRLQMKAQCLCAQVMLPDQRLRFRQHWPTFRRQGLVHCQPSTIDSPLRQLYRAMP